MVVCKELRDILDEFVKLPSRAGQDDEIGLSYVSHKECEIAELTIKSEKSKNGLSGKMISDLTTQIDQLETWASSDCDKSRCLLIEGHGGTFCSGSDLKTARATLNLTSARQLAEIMQHNFKRISELPVMSVAFLEGYALGGGAEFALAADLRIMAPGSKIGFVHAKNGICPGWGGGTRLVQLIGRSNALELLSSGRLVANEEAEQLGLSCRWDNYPTVYDFCAGHAIKSKSVSFAVKSVVQAACDLPAQRALEIEREMFILTWGKPAHVEALDKNVKHNK